MKTALQQSARATATNCVQKGERIVFDRWARIGIFAIAVTCVVVAFSPNPTSASNPTQQFAPTIEFETSTTRATAHPDARITIDNSDSVEHVEDITIDLPDGLWGSLNAALQCDYTDALAGNCAANTKIGTVVSTATVETNAISPDSDAKLSGDVFLTEAAPANTDDPAGLVIIVDAVVGGVDLGKVIVPARVFARYAALTDPTFSSLPVGTKGPPLGLRTIVEDVPNSVTDMNNRTVDFHLDKMQVDLFSNQVSPRSPLLTNSSRCTTTPFSATITSRGVEPDASLSTNYTTTDCATAVRGMTTYDYNATSTAAGTATGSTIEIEMKENSAAVRSITTIMPEALSLNSPAYGLNANMCPSSSFKTSVPLATSVFNNEDCPPEAKIGVAQITTPLLPDPLTGHLYFVATTPTPSVGIQVDPSMGSNPAGIYLSLFGQASVSTTDPNCQFDVDAAEAPEVDECRQRFSVSFNNIPNAPVSRIEIDLDEPARQRTDPGNETEFLPGEVFNIAIPNDPNGCPVVSDFRASATYHSAPSPSSIVGEVDATPLTITGCTTPWPTVIPNNPIAQHTTDTTPTFDIAGLSNCTINRVLNFEPCDAPSWTAPSALATGLHTFILDNGFEAYRAFVVDPPAQETDPPEVTFDTGPSGSTSDSTPDFSFSSDESSLFQCSLDDGAFLPCTSTTTLATTGTYQVAEPLFASDDNHTLAVRATDAVGNLSPVVTRNFDIDIPFEPQLAVDVSTTAARAHPNLEITVDTLSHEDLDEMKISLPDGFFGGLQGVQTVCPVATADAGGCTTASQIGTVETEAVVDQSLVRISGYAYLTEARTAGDAAGLSVKVEAKIQDDIDLGDIIVSGRLIVRDGAHGVDSLVLGIPNQIDPADSGNMIDGVTQFDLRSMVVNLTTGAGAAQPLLTNPSSCKSSPFSATFTGIADTATNDSVPFASTGCAALDFAPTLTTTIYEVGTTNPPGYRDPIALVASVSANPGHAGIAAAEVTLPRAINIDLQQLGFVCEQNQKANCPASSRIGSATASSPLLLPGETLNGDVFMVRNPIPGRALPWLLVKLRGRINIDLDGRSDFNANDQIVSRFENLPDAPISSFSMVVGDTQRNLLEVAREPNCPSGKDAIVGSMTGFNGSSAAVHNPVEFDCSGVYADVKSFKKRGKKTSMSVDLTTIGTQKPIKKVEFRFSKYLTLNRKNLRRKILARYGTGTLSAKKLSTKCLSASRSKRQPRLSVSLCRKRAGTVKLSFKAGSLTASRKLKKQLGSVIVTDTANKRHTLKLVTTK